MRSSRPRSISPPMSSAPISTVTQKKPRRRDRGAVAVGWRQPFYPRSFAPRTVTRYNIKDRSLIAARITGRRATLWAQVPVEHPIRHHREHLFPQKKGDGARRCSPARARQVNNVVLRQERGRSTMPMTGSPVCQAKRLKVDEPSSGTHLRCHAD
jgi:hypothetical protein